MPTQTKPTKYTAGELAGMFHRQINDVILETFGWRVEFGVLVDEKGQSVSVMDEWNPLGDFNDAALLRAKVAEKGIRAQFDFADAITAIVGDAWEPGRLSTEFAKLNASPREITTAAVLALQAERSGG